VVNGREAVQALPRAGFEFKAVVGSHHTLKHPVTRRKVSVPVHGAEDLRPGTLRTIIKDAGLTVEEFCQLLK
jgi:predicted RNA binding protein YcfA (HicA-like mRNA interferase family)